MDASMTLYYALLISELCVALALCVYAGSHVYSSLMGAPYVPTSMKIVDEILANADLKRDHVFYELGSGDGRIVRRAVIKYGVRGVGIEINPTLVFWARVKARLAGLTGVEFIIKNIYEVNLKDADIIYLFLMPKMLERLKPKLLRNTKKDALIISHGFKLPGLDSSIIKTIERKPFPTYYYRLVV